MFASFYRVFLLHKDFCVKFGVFFYIFFIFHFFVSNVFFFQNEATFPFDRRLFNIFNVNFFVFNVLILLTFVFEIILYVNFCGFHY